jgi:hypothetical protein
MVFDLDGALVDGSPLSTGLRFGAGLRPAVLHSVIPPEAPVPRIYGREGVVNHRQSCHSGMLHTENRITHHVYGVLPPDVKAQVVDGLVQGGDHPAFIDQLLPPPDPQHFARLDLGWHFESAVVDANGQERRFSYDIFAPDGSPLIYDDRGIIQGDSAQVCDLGHLSGHVAVCAYCQGRFCERCTPGMSSCLLCGFGACQGCLDELGRCRACASIRRCGWWSKRKERQVRADLINLFEGGDDYHRVELFECESGLYCRVSGQGEPPVEHVVPVTPEVRQALGLKDPR